jgi:AraC family transcriptional regulator of adaptative response / DNA-3-methyladenine glycosylase II
VAGNWDTRAVTSEELRYRAVQTRDARFDGWFFVAVTSTGIYCRPSCRSVTPKRENVRFYPSAAAAQRAGFRACKRCRPDSTPGSPEWDRRGDVVGRAMRLIADGLVDREGVAGLASRLGYGTRQLHRLLVAEVGASPLGIARAQRAQTARLLLETTDLRAGEIAFAAGFGSVRQFNDTVRTIFGLAPTAVRDRARRQRDPIEPGAVSLRLYYRRPFCAEVIFAFLSARAVAGVEEADSRSYRRTLVLPHGYGVAELADAGDSASHVRCLLRLDDLRDLSAAVRRLRRLFDLDADPAAVDDVLRGDSLLEKAVLAQPGVRIPGHVDGQELAVRAVLGQQTSVKGARALAANLVARFGATVEDRRGGLTRTFPTADVLAGVDAAELPLPRQRARALLAVCESLASGDIAVDPGADREHVSERLVALPGVGPWTVSYIQMRALGDPDAFLPSDLGVRRGLEALGRAGDPRAAAELAERWRPYRAYALQYLWSLAANEKARSQIDKEYAA